MHACLLGETLLLDLTGGFDTLTDGLRRFAAIVAGERLVIDQRNFNMKIDAIEKRAANALTITLNGGRAATALAFVGFTIILISKLGIFSL